MAWTDRRPLRWSKKTDDLVKYVALRCRPGFQSELGHWLEERPRFRDLIAFNQDKVRKKLTTADDEERRQDVRAELRVAYLVLADRRFEVALEAYGAQRLGPDISVTYRANQRFNLEVTRLRSGGSPTVTRLSDVIGGKLRQLPADVPNALVITGHDLAVSEACDDYIDAALRLLRTHGKQNDLTRLGGVFMLDEGGATTPAAVFGANREARHALSKEVVAGLSACLNSAAE